MTAELDEHYMRLALDEARAALRFGEVPVGAVLVREEQVLARGHNGPISQSDPTAHAEIVVVRAAARLLENYRLTGTVLYVTIEPCAMCVGALVHARVTRLVYGAADARVGAAGSVFDLTRDRRLNHRLEVTGGVLEAECRSIIQEFFQDRRG
ncbi:MAG: tRNA adenosine(34) deaminase TadA [Deltaproteobacteria bacterium]|nr:tRNA adenosine(34) deaminase TadA [Deltaproteobacteria bacterium]